MTTSEARYATGRWERQHRYRLVLLVLGFLTYNTCTPQPSPAAGGVSLPTVTAREEQAVVQVVDILDSAVGTGFVVGYDAGGRAIALTNEHVVASRYVEVYTADAKAIRRVDILHTCTDRDLALLRFRPRGRLGALPLSPRDSPTPAGAPVVALHAEDYGLETYRGSFVDASTLNNSRGSSAFFHALGRVRHGSSGGPVLARSPGTGAAEVVGVTARGNAWEWFGPSVEAIHSFLDEARAAAGPITLGVPTPVVAGVGDSDRTPTRPARRGRPGRADAGITTVAPTLPFPWRRRRTAQAAATAAFSPGVAPTVAIRPWASDTPSERPGVVVRQSSGGVIEVTLYGEGGSQVLTVGSSGVTLGQSRDPFLPLASGRPCAGAGACSVFSNGRFPNVEH